MTDQTPDTGEQVFDVGDLVEVEVFFTNDDGDPVDPTDVQFRYKKPGQAKVILNYLDDAEIVRRELGNFYCRLSLDTTRRWRVGFYGTGAYQSAAKTSFVVRENDLDD